jgi:DNA processing protein
MKNIDSKYLLCLNAHPKIGSQTMKKILDVYDNPERMWSVSSSDLIKTFGEKIGSLVIEAIRDYKPDQEVERIKKYDLGFVTIYDKEYPKLLREIHDCPAVLYIKGSLKALQNPSIAVVGSRKYSSYGAKVAYSLAKECSQNGLTVISGLALGIDAFAHQAAVDSGGITIGVLGCGLDQIYPASNFQLSQRILEMHGAIISEFPIGTPPMKQNFPARNRIVAGMSMGTLVIEAAESSGALITAYQALDYGRDVFAVPGNIDSPMSVGTNSLIKKGAIPVSCITDILEAMAIEEKSNIQKSIEILPETENEKKLYEILSTGEKSVDQIVEKSKLNVIALNTLFTIMEMKGLIQNIGGGRYKLK